MLFGLSTVRMISLTVVFDTNSFVGSAIGENAATHFFRVSVISFPEDYLRDFRYLFGSYSNLSQHTHLTRLNESQWWEGHEHGDEMLKSREECRGEADCRCRR